jgi:hypothetical protein
MTQARMMTLDEKLDLALESFKLKDAGRLTEAVQLQHQIPIAPFIAKFAKQHYGPDFLAKTGWNFSEAEHEFGPHWLTR